MATTIGIGGWFAQAVIQTSIDKLSSSAIQLLHPGLNDALNSLNTSLPKANAILAVSHKMKEGKDLTVLLKRLKEAVYDASDLLDELEYEKLKLKVEGEGHQLSGLIPDAIKFTSDLLNDPTSKAREVQKRLDEITTAIEQVVSVSSINGAKQQSESARVRNETSSVLRNPEVFGRAEDLKRLTEFLMKPDEGSQSSNKVVVPVISLVGMGGVGKTTLAQCAYSKLKKHFEEKIWICASSPFDVNRLTKEIVETVDKENSTLTKFGHLQEIVKKKLGSKRFLLVIDDVWNEDWEKWETFSAPLRLGAPGSKILVTTRSHNVAATVNANYKMTVEGLKKEIYYSFFRRCAFGCEDPQKYHKMEVIGRKIAVRLKGLPLAAKTLGNLLRLHFNEDYWRNILYSEIWNLEQHASDIIPVLKLSFDDLSPCLKSCFAYCSIFPKGYWFDKDLMVQRWMAQDFIVPKANWRMEDVGRSYFDDLISRCLLQTHPRGDDRYVIHDLLHDLAQSVSYDECVILERNRPRDIPSTVRHLTVRLPYPDLNIGDICKQTKLRTLLVVSDDAGHLDVEFNAALEDLLSNLTHIRVLQLRILLNMLPECIDKLKQLRYLDIFATNHQFPESLCVLYNLQSFKVLTHLFYPKGMENLVNLRNVPTIGFVDQIDIGRLTSLQTLGTLNMKKEGRKIQELQKLNELGGKLCIEHLEMIDSKEETSKAKLKDKKYLTELSLKWASDMNTNLRTNVSDMEVLEGLQPHPNLEVLEILSYHGLRYPSWLESQLLSNLITVRLIDCENMEQLPPLGQLPCLKFLQLEGLNLVKRVGEELYGSNTTAFKAFPLLEKLMLKNMLGWEEWSPGYSSQLFCCLQELHIEKCPKLTVLPYLPPKVIKLVIIDVQLTEFPPLGHLSCLETLHYARVGAAVRKIEDLFGVTTTNVFLSLEELEFVDMPEFEEWSGAYGSQYFPCLKRLVIKECPKLRNLPCLPPSLVELMLVKVGLDALPVVWVSQESSHQNASSLVAFLIDSCPNLKSLEEWLLPNQLPALQGMCIIDCNELTSLPIGTFKDFAFLQSLTLRDCPKLTSARAMQAVSDTEFASLRFLELGCCGDLERPLFLCFRGATALSELVVSNCRHITTLAGEYLHHLPTLKYLELERLPELVTFRSLQCFTSLQHLVIRDCPKLKAMPEDNLPTSVSYLSLSNCHPDLKQRCQKDTGDDWPKISHISSISIDGEEIQWEN